MEAPNSPIDELDVVSEQDLDATDRPSCEAIDSIIFLMVGSRPMIVSSVGNLAQYFLNPK